MIQIKNPCDADWQKMTPQPSGKFCASCEKVVVDFSKMNDAQIKQYFADYATQKTCGRFLTTQLERPLNGSSNNFFTTYIHKLNRLPVFRSVLLLITSMSVWMSGCVKNNDMTTGEPIDSSSTCTTPLTDDSTMIIKNPDNKQVLPSDTIIKMGEVAAPLKTKVIPIVIGDVSVSSEPDTVHVNIPDKPRDCSSQKSEELPEDDVQLIVGKVMMVDTIGQKIKRRK